MGKRKLEYAQFTCLQTMGTGLFFTLDFAFSVIKSPPKIESAYILVEQIRRLKSGLYILYSGHAKLPPTESKASGYIAQLQADVVK